MDVEDLEPRKRRTPPKDLSGFSIEELGEYIERLSAEIQRAEQAIAAKRAHRGGAEALFKR
jgi:uncharacterized small protein (DUF1192 family)